MKLTKVDTEYLTACWVCGESPQEVWILTLQPNTMADLRICRDCLGDIYIFIDEDIYG